MRVCTEPGCGTLVERGRCAVHGGLRQGVPRRNGASEPAKRTTLARARGKCERCGKGASLIVHHRIPRSQGGSDEASNLEALCKGCHDAEHRAMQPRLYARK